MHPSLLETFSQLAKKKVEKNEKVEKKEKRISFTYVISGGSVSSSESKNRNVWGIITQISLTYTSKCFKNYLNLKTANGFHKDTDTIRCPTVSIEVLTSKGTFVVLCTYIVHFRWNFSISHFSQLFFSPPVIFPKFSDGSPRNLFLAPLWRKCLISYFSYNDT